VILSTVVIRVPPLPFQESALAPFLSERTVHYHRRKQDRYVHRTNELVRGTPLEGLTLGAVVHEAERSLDADDEPSPWIETLFEQSAQAWNHALMWRSMAPPTSRRSMPGWTRDLQDDWHDAIGSVFGSGWVWLVVRTDGHPAVEATEDADRPSLGRPLMVMDLWEHAYYLDYPDARHDYASDWWNKLADWDFAERTVEVGIPEDLR
jgi:Fe-Mn family superoxide dismutase